MVRRRLTPALGKRRRANSPQRRRRTGGYHCALVRNKRKGPPKRAPARRQVWI